MWQRIYLERLKRDIERWIERGWITPANAQAMLADMGAGQTTRYIPQVLAVMGAVLVGLAAMSFVAANWAAIPKAVKLAMLFTLLWSAWGAAFIAHRRGHSGYAEAAVVGGLALFGANIMLIAQIYHLSSTTPLWLLIWSLVALAAAWGLPSRSALAISFLLTCIWSLWSGETGEILHWGFLAPWALGTWLTVRLSWRSGLHLALITLLVWCAVNADPMIRLLNIEEGDMTALFVLVATLLWIVGLRVSARSLRFGWILELYGMVVAFVLIWTLQIQTDDSSVGFSWWATALIAFALVAALAQAELSATRLALRDYVGLLGLSLGALLYPLLAHHEGWTMLFYATLFMALSVWLVAYGTSRNHRFALNAGLVAFSGECLYLYFQTLGTLLDTAAFFALGGIILIAGSIILPRLRRRLVESVNAGDQA
tara:strand:- start:25423 stop:26703 length:1281 start_codon:yes stop_codon:yes gene_type:complete